MDFQKVEDFIRLHWPAALMVAIIVAPSVWGIASLHFSERITVLELGHTQLTTKIKTLEELADRRREKDKLEARSPDSLEASSSGFTTAELYTPSPTP